MCILESNVPTSTYFDEPCEGMQAVNIYKRFTTKKEIETKDKKRIEKVVFATCEDALTLQGLTGSESLTG